MVLAECTQASFEIGYELTYAEAQGKEAYIFYMPNETRLSAMLAGNWHFHIHRYKPSAKESRR